MQGGELVFYVSNKRVKEGNNEFPVRKQSVSRQETVSFSVENYSETTPFAKLNISFTLNKQFRTWPLTYAWQGDTLLVRCKEAVYKTPRSVVESANGFCWNIPSDGAIYDVKGTFAFISRQALRDLQKNGYFIYNGITWRQVPSPTGEGQGETPTIHVRADIDRTEMWISLKDELPLVIEMRNNPLGIDWKITK